MKVVLVRIQLKSPGDGGKKKPIGCGGDIFLSGLLS